MADELSSEKIGDRKSSKLKTLLRNRKKILFVAGGVILLLVVSVILVKTIGAIQNRIKHRDGPAIGGPTIGPAVDNKDQKQTAETGGDSKSNSSLPACANTKELFSTFPVEDGKYTSIVPLGNLNPTSHTFPTDHIYVEVADPRYPKLDTVAKAKSLIAPADMWILGIQSSEEVGGITDYAIDFSPCKDVQGKFGHVGSISAALQTEINKVKSDCDEYETGGRKYRSCRYNGLNIPVKAGEKIGTAGSERSGALDIWLSDYREPPVKRANESRWYSDRNNVSCFLDYYPATQKDQFYSFLLGPGGGKRTKEPRCGTVEVDIAGAAQGVWAYNLEGLFQQEDPHLALVFDNVETDEQVFSVGTAAISAGIPSGRYFFTPNSEGKVNRDFSQVTADGTVYCYDTKKDGVAKSILLAMPTAVKLQLKKSSTACGAGPWQMTDGFIEYDR
jgi:hypothetical protein